VVGELVLAAEVGLNLLEGIGNLLQLEGLKRASAGRIGDALQDFVARAAAIREAVLTKQMPPWKADPRYGKWSNDWSLSDDEIAMIKGWVDEGSKEGDPTRLPAPPVFSTDWKIGKPDVILAIQPHTITATGPDEYEQFTVPTNFSEDKWVVAAELRPGNLKIVHHAHVFVVEPDGEANKGAKKEASKDAQAEYSKWLVVNEKKLSWIRPEAPVIDDGCVVDDNAYWPGKKPRDAQFGTWGMLSLLARQRTGYISQGHGTQDSRRRRAQFPDSLLQSHQEARYRRHQCRADLCQRAA